MIDLFQEILGTLKRNKLRTFLTGFAVAWGIFMLIVLLGAGNGLINALNDAIKGISANSVEVYPGVTSKAFKGYKTGRFISLEEKDIDVTRKAVGDHIIEIGADVQQSGINLINDKHHVNITLNGVFPIYMSTQGYKLKQGRFINELDIKNKRKVIVIHRKTMEQLFEQNEYDQVIGKYLNASGVAYRVVGIYEDRGNMQPSAMIPFTTLKIIYNKGKDLNSIMISTKNISDEKRQDLFEEAIRSSLGAKHEFAPDDRRAIWVWSMFKQLKQQDTGMSILRTAIWVIGIFTLLSGIVGVSNIMLITVKERTREFGIRKALGAKPLSILWLIIVESVTITTIFGYLGMLVGIAATEYMNIVAGTKTVDIGVAQATVFSNPTVDISIAIQATLTLIIAGTLAGFFPARKAVMIKPIEALRAE